MVAEDSLVFAHIRDIKDFSAEHNDQLREFFVHYSQVENKKLTGTKFIRAKAAEMSLEKLIK